jgi:hypothetical protein
MANIDAVFTKSNLDESRKMAKMLFGRLLIALRKSNHIKLYSLLESVVDSNYHDNVFELTLSDKVAFDMINNKSDIEVLVTTLATIQNGARLSLMCSGKEPFDVYKFESRLKEEFGKILTIKKD